MSCGALASNFLRRAALNFFILSSQTGIFPQKTFFLTILSHKNIFCLSFSSGDQQAHPPNPQLSGVRDEKELREGADIGLIMVRFDCTSLGCERRLERLKNAVTGHVALIRLSGGIL
jgi:hypothetical protein